MNKVIFAFTAIISTLATNTTIWASTVITPGDCISCTDTRTGLCTQYGIGCCDPCKSNLAPVDPVDPVDPIDPDPSEFPSGCENCKYWDWTQVSTGSGLSKKYYETKCNELGHLGTGEKTGICAFRCGKGYWGARPSESNLGTCNACPSAPGVKDSTVTDVTPIIPTPMNSISSTSGTGSTLSVTPVMPGGIKPFIITVVTSDIDNNENITDCYISGGNYEDETGYFTLAGDCHHRD